MLNAQFEIVGILGSNGAGKTNFFNLLTGLFLPTEGKIFYKVQDITYMSPQERVSLGLTRTFQLTSTFDSLSVIDNLALVHFRTNFKTSIQNLLFTRRKSLYNNPEILSTLNIFDLELVKERVVKNLSLG